MKNWHLVIAVGSLNYLLWLALSELSHLLSGTGLAVHFDVLFVLFPALFLTVGPSLTICVLMAFIIGVHRPVSIGLTLLSLCLLWHLALWMRARLRRDHLGHVAGLGAALQALFVLGWSFSWGSSGMDGSVFWIRVLGELLVSVLVVGVLAGWWCQWQTRLLEEFGWTRETN
jgi:hypothetical protein